jgi:hypothetical protein
MTLLSEPKTWRQVLATLIADAKERKRISQTSGIDEVTLKRYAEHKTKSIRSHMLRSLVAAVPAEARPLLIARIQEEFPACSFAEAAPVDGLDRPEEVSERVQVEVYERVLRAHATTPLALRFWAICHLVLGAALEQLDPSPHPVGVKVVLVQCLRSAHHGVVHSLRETAFLGTGPWQTDHSSPLFLGAESLSGYAVSSCRPAICQNLRANPTFLPIRQEAHEESAVAYPLRQGERVGGCLLVVAAKVNFFTAPRLSLVEAYTDLADLALQDHQFYEQPEIHLRAMPATDVQHAHFASFRKRVDELVHAPDRQIATIIEAEHLVWQDIAEELMSPGP